MTETTAVALPEGDYVLGTGDPEVERLGLQHLVWRPRASDAWRRAGFTVGQHLIDIGCGPGYASIDLAGIVGDKGKITAVDRSPAFLDILRKRLASARIGNVTTVDQDLDEGRLPQLNADGAWVRWVFAFLTKPRQLLGAIHRALKPGATLVIHEYFDYAEWRISPREPEFEEFVQAVITSWRKSGGEPNIGLDLMGWLPKEGFEIRELRPIVDIITPRDFIWQWPSSFLEIGIARLVSLGYLADERASQIRETFRRIEKDPDTRMITPGVLEIIATRR
ncbi:MAG TPA: methyltransferase domain-containing protein [Gemmatimonadaceae bacterium]|nr:methyltransferase domain-containing protein [Gemmatimonadaceae bacterium]